MGSYSIIIKLFSAFLTEVLLTATAITNIRSAKTAAVTAATVTVVLLSNFAESSGIIAMIMKTNRAIYITNPTIRATAFIPPSLRDISVSLSRLKTGLLALLTSIRLTKIKLQRTQTNALYRNTQLPVIGTIPVTMQTIPRIRMYETLPSEQISMEKRSLLL